jgi:cobalt/nickel transport system permease protein
MSHFDPEKYARLQSPIHNWDPRARTLSLFILLFSVALAGSIPKALAGLSVSFLLILISRLPLHHVAGFMKWPVLFLLPFLIILPFTTTGDTLLSIAFLTASVQGFYMGLLFFIRGLGAALLALLIVGTAPFTATVKALQSMGLPNSLAQIFLFAYRYVFLLSEELQTMSRSMESKGFVKRSDLRTARIYSRSLAMMLIRSYERSEDIFLAMLSRGYMGKVPSGSGSKISGNDIVKSCLVVAAAMCIQAF